MGIIQNEIGSWDTRKGKLKWRYPFLTDHDLFLDSANRDQMIANLSLKLHMTTKELHATIIAL